MDILGQSSVIVGVTSFALGFSILARNVRNKLYRAFAVLSALISGWALAFFLDKVWPGDSFYRWHLLFNIWVTPAALTLIRVMARVKGAFSRVLLNTSIVLSLCFTVVLVLRLESKSFFLQLIYFMPVVVLFQLIHLMWNDRKLRTMVSFGRRGLIYLGGLICLVTSVMDHVTFMGPWFASAGNIILAIYLFFVSQAITEQRLLNFSALFSRFTVLMAVALTLTGLFWLLVAWVQDSPALFFLNSFIASFLILMLLEPLRSTVRYFTERLLSKEHRFIEQTLKEAQRKLAGIVDPGMLFHSILVAVDQVLKPEWAALFVLRGDGTRYRRVRTVGIEAEGGHGQIGDSILLREILADHPLLKHCEYLNKKGELPILLDQILENEIDRSASKTQRVHLGALIQGLRALGGNLLVPLIATDKVLGFLILRVLSPPSYWGSNWGFLRIVYPYLEQSANTMKNLEVFVRQREKERLAALGEMAAGLAHEIRNPLGAIKGAAQFLDPESDRPESKFLRVIIEEVDRLNRVVTQFLDYSRPGNMEMKPIDIAQLVQKCVELMKSSARAGVKLLSEPFRGSVLVLASAEQIQQVLINLIQNSFNALSAEDGDHSSGNSFIKVSMDVEDSAKPGEVAIHVEDNGPGIKKENLEKLFIPFFTTSPSGTGLGLSISQKIIEAHKGRIEVSTEEGKFAKFSVILPMVPMVKE